MGAVEFEGICSSVYFFFGGLNMVSGDRVHMDSLYEHNRSSCNLLGVEQRGASAAQVLLPTFGAVLLSL